MTDAEIETAYHLARTSFESFSISEADEVPDDAMSTLQVRAIRWVTRWFGAPEPTRRALALVEELGELAEAVQLMSAAVAERQGVDKLEAIAGDVDKELGDVVICMAGMAATARLALGAIWAVSFARPASPPPPTSSDTGELLVEASAIARVALKRACGLRGLDEDDAYRRACHRALLAVGRRLARLMPEDAARAAARRRAAEVFARTY